MKFLVEDFEDFDLKDYLTDEVIEYSTYITRDGKFVDLEGGTHGASDEFFREYDIDKSILYGAITLNDGKNPYDPLSCAYIHLPGSLTTEQYDSLLRWLDNLEIDDKVDIDGQVRYSLSDYTPDEIIKKIKRYYASGHLYENKIRRNK